MAYDVERHMTIPARPRGTPAAKDRAPGPARRRRGLRVALTVTVAVCAAVVAVVAGVGLVRSASGGPPVKHAAAAGSAAANSAIDGSGKVRPATGQAALPPLSSAQLAGQRVIYSYTGLTPPASLLRWIRAGKVAGVIFFGPNISSQAQLAAVATELDQANASPQNPLRHYPLLLMTDQEGGLVRRLPGAPDESEKQIGEAARPAAAAKAAGRGAGQNLTGPA